MYFIKLVVNQIYQKIDVPAYSNPFYTPKPNGCGSKEFKLPSWLMPQFKSCCNNHDRCYGRCNSVKASCDNVFRDCMKKTCSNVACRSMADAFYVSVKNFACTAYTRAQSKACLCYSTRI